MSNKVIDIIKDKAERWIKKLDGLENVITEENSKVINTCAEVIFKNLADYFIKDVLGAITENIKFVEKTTLTVSLAAIPLLISMIDKMDNSWLLLVTMLAFFAVIILQINRTNSFSNSIEKIFIGDENEEKEAIKLLQNRITKRKFSFLYNYLFYFNLAASLSIITAAVYIYERW